MRPHESAGGQGMQSVSSWSRLPLIHSLCLSIHVCFKGEKRGLGESLSVSRPTLMPLSDKSSP
jgi:hypothetical protein